MIKLKNIHSKGRKWHQTNNFRYKSNNNDNNNHVNKRHDKTTATDEKEEAKIRWRRKVNTGTVDARNKLHRHIIPILIDHDDNNHTKTTGLTKQQLTSEDKRAANDESPKLHYSKSATIHQYKP